MTLIGSPLVPCIGCGGLFPEVEGSTHPYLESSPGCAAACGELFACYYSEMPFYADVYRLANDAYAVQHPGRPSRQTINSAGIHLIRLCLTFEYQLPAALANDAVLAAGRRKKEFFWLEPPTSRGTMTVADFNRALSREEHKALLREWARSAWTAWSRHHATIRQWLPHEWMKHAL